MRLDHVTIVSSECERLLAFFTGIAGMKDGARPAFGFPGHWLYLDERPVLHLIERAAEPISIRSASQQAATRIDHLALRIGSADAWRALLQGLRRSGTPYQLSDMRALKEQQLFVQLAPELTVEFVADTRYL